MPPIAQEMSYIETASSGYYDYIIEVPFNLWLRGETAKKTGFMFTLEPKRYDIFGFILKKAGYSDKDLLGMRVPSQLAQHKHRSGSPMVNCACFLTTSGHADTDTCIELGMLNDSVKLDDMERQKRISELLKVNNIGIRFTEKIFLQLTRNEAKVMFEEWITRPDDLISSFNTKTFLMDPLYKSYFRIVYTTKGDKIIFMLYDANGSAPNEVVTSGVISSTSKLILTLLNISDTFCSSNSLWFESRSNVRKLSEECQIELLTTKIVPARYTSYSF